MKNKAIYKKLSIEEVAAIRINPPLNLSELEAAAYLGVCERTVRNLRDRRIISHVKLGGRILYLRNDLDDTLARMRVQGV